MAWSSAPDLLVLHAVRLAGMADSAMVARRFGLSPAEVHELLLDDEARGWVQRVAFADVSGWLLTPAGRVEHARRLFVELADAGARPAVVAVHEELALLDARFQAAMTHWRIRPVPGEPSARNDHRDARWDEHVLVELHVLVRAATSLCARLTSHLDRFAGYADRLGAALDRVDRGELAWLDEPRSDSLLGTWSELSEDVRVSRGLPTGEPGHSAAS